MKKYTDNLKILFGSGDTTKKGFISVDIVPSKKVKTDIVIGTDWIEKNKKLPFDDSSVAEIEAKDVLEHLPTKKSSVLSYG